MYMYIITLNLHVIIDYISSMVSELCLVSSLIPQCARFKFFFVFVNYILIRLFGFSYSTYLHSFFIFFFVGISFWSNDLFIIYFSFEVIAIISYLIMGIHACDKSGLKSVLNYFLVGFLCSIFFQSAFVCFSLPGLRLFGLFLAFVSFITKLGMYPFNF